MLSCLSWVAWVVWGVLVALLWSCMFALDGACLCTTLTQQFAHVKVVIVVSSKMWGMSATGSVSAELGPVMIVTCDSSHNVMFFRSVNAAQTEPGESQVLRFAACFLWSISQEFNFQSFYCQCMAWDCRSNCLQKMCATYRFVISLSVPRCGIAADNAWVQRSDSLQGTAVWSRLGLRNQQSMTICKTRIWWSHCLGCPYISPNLWRFVCYSGAFGSQTNHACAQEAGDILL